MDIKSNTENTENQVNKAWNFVVIGLFLLSFVVFYALKANSLIKWISFLLILSGSGGVFFFLSPLGLSLRGYFKDSWNELQKVVWPTRKETMQFTWVVFLFVLLIAIFLWIADSAFSWVLYDLVFKR